MRYVALSGLTGSVTLVPRASPWAFPSRPFGTNNDNKNPKPENDNKKTPSRHRPGVRSFLHFDARCEPYGRRFRSARNNNKARRFRSDTILLLYLARAGRSSAVLAWGEKSERALEGWPHGASAVRHRRRAAGRSQLRRKWLLCNALRANAERSWGRSHAKRRDEMGSKRSHEKGVLC